MFHRRQGNIAFRRLSAAAITRCWSGAWGDSGCDIETHLLCARVYLRSGCGKTSAPGNRANWRITRIWRGERHRKLWRGGGIAVWKRRGKRGEE